jgi:hypothetical protein
MNRDEAKLILQACRPDGRDAADPYFAEALALAKSDAELSAWFAQQQKFDSLICGGLNQMRPPASLKAEILALEKKAEISAKPQSKKSEVSDHLPVSVWWWNLFTWQANIAWATALVLLLSLFVFWNKTPAATFQDFSTQMVSTALHDPHHADAAANDLKSALVWLGEHRGENDLVPPAALNGSGQLGCRVLAWHGGTVSMLCYHTPEAGHMDLFVADAKMFADAPPVDQPRFASNDQMPTASWSHDGKAYLLVGHDAATDLKKLLSQSAVAEIKLSSTPAQLVCLN